MNLKDLGLENVESTRREAVGEFEGMVKVINITGPDSISRTAKQLNINTGEVFVRLTVTDGTSNNVLSNKLKFIDKEDYQALVEARDKGTEINLHVTTYKSENPSRAGQLDAFFYVVHNTTVDDVFNQIKEATKAETTVEAVAERMKAKLLKKA